MAKTLLGELLVQNGEITREHLDEALKIQEKDGGLIGIILKRLGHIDEAKLIEYLTLQATQRVSEGKKMTKEEDS